MSVVINGSAGVTTNSGAVYNGISSGTAVASTSGTSIDFTSIPSWVKRVTVMFSGVSLSGTDDFLILLSSSSTFATTGYISTSIAVNNASQSNGASSTSGFVIYSGVAAGITSGHFVMTLIDSNKWASSHCVKSGTTAARFGGGDTSLSGSLDGVRITTTGSNTFDAGSINILYE